MADLKGEVCGPRKKEKKSSGFEASVASREEKLGSEFEV